MKNGSTEIKPLVTIPDSLIKRVQGLGAHFCLVEANGKSPHVGGKGWQKRENLMMSDNPRLKEHLQCGGNYGVVGGYGLVIVDADIEEVRKIVEEKLPETYTVESAGSKGWHAYFQCGLENPIRLRDKNKENVGDIQGQGKMVVGPNSIHPNGNRYNVIKDVPLAQVSAKELREAFKEFLKQPTTHQPTKTLVTDEFNITDFVSLTNLQKSGDEYQGSHPIHGSKGGKNFTVNPTKNVWKCFRHDSGGGALLWLAVQEGIIDCSEATRGVLRGDAFKKVKRKALEITHPQRTKKTLDPEKYIDNSYKYFKKNPFTRRISFVPRMLGDKLLCDYFFVTERKSRETYVFDKTHYKADADTFIHEQCIKELGDEYRDSRFNEVLKYIKGRTYTDFKKQPPLNLINAENGIFDVITKTLYHHSPQYLFFNVVPLSYKANGDVSSFIEWLYELTNDKTSVKKLLMWFAYNLLRKNPYQLCLLLVGRTGAGKSVYFDFMKEVLGSDNISNRSLHELCTDKFACADLNGRLSNTCGDLPRAPLKYIDMFLRIIGGDTITIQHKFAHATTMTPTQKLSFASNQPPLPKDSQKAFYRRVMLIICPNMFLGKNRDVNKVTNLTTQKVKDGMLGLVSDFLNLLLLEDGFGINYEETQEEYIKWANPMELFWNLCVVDREDSTILKKELFRAYTNFCKTNSYNNELEKDFKKFIENKAIYEKRVNAERHWADIAFTLQGLTHIPKKNEKQTKLMENEKKLKLGSVAKLPKIPLFTTRDFLVNVKSIVVEKTQINGFLAIVEKWSKLDKNYYQHDKITGDKQLLVKTFRHKNRRENALPNIFSGKQG